MLRSLRAWGPREDVRLCGEGRSSGAGVVLTAQPKEQSKACDDEALSGFGRSLSAGGKMLMKKGCLT